MFLNISYCTYWWIPPESIVGKKQNLVTKQKPESVYYALWNCSLLWSFKKETFHLNSEMTWENSKTTISKRNKSFYPERK